MWGTLRASLYITIPVKDGQANHDLPWVACLFHTAFCLLSHTEGQEEGGQSEQGGWGGDNREESLVSSSGLMHTDT